jgi:hypothetical protein
MDQMDNQIETFKETPSPKFGSGVEAPKPRIKNAGMKANFAAFMDEMNNRDHKVSQV